MTKQQALNAINAGLSNAIDRYLATICEEPKPEWEALNVYMAHDLVDRMADAALNVLRATAEHEYFLRNERIID